MEEIDSENTPQLTEVILEEKTISATDLPQHSELKMNSQKGSSLPKLFQRKKLENSTENDVAVSEPKLNNTEKTNSFNRRLHFRLSKSSMHRHDYSTKEKSETKLSREGKKSLTSFMSGLWNNIFKKSSIAEKSEDVQIEDLSKDETLHVCNLSPPPILAETNSQLSED